MDDSYLVIARRYRPKLFSDVIGQDAIIRTLKNAIQSRRISHAYLFAGSRGTGKTSIARLFAKALNCAALLPSGEPCNACPSCLEIAEGRSLDVQEIDGASNRGIDHIRLLTESASYAPACGRYKIYLIDEVHMLTKEAFNALLKTLEEPPPSVKFFFATTEPHKIPTTIISRCQRFNLKRLSLEAIVSKLQLIVNDMNVAAEEGALRRLACYADGGLRDAESLLDQVITFSNGHVSQEIVEEVFGIVPLTWLLELDRAIATADIRIAYTISDRVFHEGKDIGHFIDDVTDHYRSLLLLKLNIPSQPSAHDTDTQKALCTSAAALSQEHLLEILNILAEAQSSLKTAASQRFLLEWILLSIVRIQRKVPLPLIARKLFELQDCLIGNSPVPTQPVPTVTQPCESVLSQLSPSKQVQTEQSLPSAAATAKQESPSFHETNTARQAAAGAIAPSGRQTKQKKEMNSESQNDGAEAQQIEPLKKERKKPPQNRPAPVSSLPPEQENARHENLVQFAAVELGATIIKTT
jgi:DNA polymerase-3 subunit gamma/tau